ncbi:MAG: hypothetical protein JWN98_2729 [Abditibacteriota bacterium]|nr:hypothetical protein [Abditibacteriota bacterium]
MKLFSPAAPYAVAAVFSTVLLSAATMPAQDEPSASTAGQPALVPLQGEARQPATTPKTEKYDDPKVQLNYINMDVRAALKMLGDRTGQQIIVGEGVRGHVKFEVRARKLSEVLDSMGRIANFEWDRVGGNVILVVARSTSPLFVTPITPAEPPRQSFVIPGTPAPAGPPSSWRPFEFNDSTVYIVPLQPARLANPETVVPTSPLASARPSSPTGPSLILRR